MDDFPRGASQRDKLRIAEMLAGAHFREQSMQRGRRRIRAAPSWQVLQFFAKIADV